MKTLTDIPEEILLQIVGHLQNQKHRAYFFASHPAVTKDLQNIRLVCHRLASLAASFLFENIICDEELYTPENVFQITNFAMQYPHLALHVRRLQWKIAPAYPSVHGLAFDLTLILQSRIDCMDIQVMYMLLLKPYQGQIRNTNKMSVFQICSQENVNVPLDSQDLLEYRLSKLRSVIRLLPNIYHLEITSSAKYRRYTRKVATPLIPERARIFQRGFDNNLKMIEEHNMGFLCAWVCAYGVPRVTSLKLVDNSAIPLDALRWQRLLQLEQLDLRMRPYWVIDESERDSVLAPPAQYCEDLDLLKNLRTLRLLALGDWATTFYLNDPPPDGKDPKDIHREYFYVDNLLKDVQLPHLQSLSLANFPVREAGLCRIIRNHPKLRYLELRKLTMELPVAEYATGGINSWKRVATACADLPALRRVVLEKLRFYISGFLHEDIEDPESLQAFRWQSMKPQAIAAMYLLAGSVTADGWIQRDDHNFSNFEQVTKALDEIPR